MPIKQRCLALASILAIGAAQAQMATPPPSVPPAAQPMKAPTRPAAPLPPPAAKSSGFSSDAGESARAAPEGYPAAPQIVVPLKRNDAGDAPATDRAAPPPPATRAAPAAQPRTAKSCDKLTTRNERAACRKAASPPA